MFQPVGGMDAIVTGLVEAVGADRIRTGAQVTQITSLADGVEVTWRGGRIKADYCVATLPPHVLAKIPHNLGEPVTAALRTPVPVAAGKIGLEYGRRWWEIEDRIYGGITETDLDITHIWYPSHDYHAARGLVVGYYNTGAERRAVRRAHPRGPPPPRAHPGQEDPRREVPRGRAVEPPRSPGSARSTSRAAGYAGRSIDSSFTLLQRPSARVYFAGDWLTHLIAWQAGAMESARSAVTQLHQRVLQSP